MQVESALLSAEYVAEHIDEWEFQPLSSPADAAKYIRDNRYLSLFHSAFVKV